MLLQPCSPSQWLRCARQRPQWYVRGTDKGHRHWAKLAVTMPTVKHVCSGARDSGGPLGEMADHRHSTRRREQGPSSVWEDVPRGSTEPAGSVSSCSFSLLAFMVGLIQDRASRYCPGPGSDVHTSKSGRRQELTVNRHGVLLLKSSEQRNLFWISICFTFAIGKV